MRLLMTWLLGLTVWVAPLLGQSYTEPAPKIPTEKGSAVEWLAAAIFMVCCLAVAFKPARRSNLK
ncbi:MAG: hypothetical protein KA354_07480 [Phycisphaerae bacterium]|nr:hypothetical protein [Phycisphaerae bacterium]